MLQTTAPALFYDYVRGYYTNWKDAAQDLKNSIVLKQAGFEEYVKLIELYLTHNRVVEARQLLERLRSTAIAEQHPVEIDYLEAKVLIAEGSLKKAKTLLEKHMDKADQYPVIYAAFGELLRKMGKPDEARFMFVLAYKNRPAFYEMLLKIGHAYYEAQKWENALEIYKRLIGLLVKDGRDPTEAEKNILVKAYDRLGAIYLIQGKFDASKAELEKALFHDPTFFSAVYNLATVEFKIGVQKREVARLNQALALYHQVIEAKEWVQEALFGKARCLEELGRLTKDPQKQILAQDIYEMQAAEPKPFPKAVVKLTELAYYENDPLKMLDLAVKAVLLLPNDAMAAMNLGEAYRWNGRYEDAVQAYFEAKDLAKEEGTLERFEIQIHFGIADCLVWLHRLDGVRYFMQPIEDKINPSSLVEWDRLCAIYDLLADKPHFNKFWEIGSKQKGVTKEKFDQLLKDIKGYWKELTH